MLRNIPEIISPELMKALMEMGHGDEICFCDVNFPAAGMGANSRVIRADGHTIPVLLEAVLEFMPLDVFVEKPCVLMDAPEGSHPAVWTKYQEVIGKHDFANAHKEFEKEERFAFYDRAQKCFALVATSEHEAYSNIILKKGVIFK